jgi:hypothetical protein
MQALGVFSFVCAVFTMYTIYIQWKAATGVVFAIGLLSLLVSLIISLVEITQSTKALELELSDIEEPGRFEFIKGMLGIDKKED